MKLRIEMLNIHEYFIRLKKTLDKYVIYMTKKVNYVLFGTRYVLEVFFNVIFHGLTAIV